MEAQLLEDAISEYQQSLKSITEALEASPEEGELLEVSHAMPGPPQAQLCACHRHRAVLSWRPRLPACS